MIGRPGAPIRPGLGSVWTHRFGAYPTAFPYDPDAAIDQGPDPVSAEGLVFTTAPDDAVVALDAATGALRWRFDAATGAERWRNDDLGARGTFIIAPTGSGAISWGYPALSDGRLLLA